MEIFQTAQTHFAVLGIRPSNQTTRKYSDNRKILFGFLLFVCNAVSQFVYIVHVANGFMEFMDCICATSGSTIVFVGFTTIVFKRTLLFENIDNLQKLIDTSKPFLSYYSWPQI